MYKLRLKALSGLLLCGSLIIACTSSPDVSATITAANNLASNENRPLALPGFSNCSEAMCWNGIIPGVTTFDAAKSIIQAIYPQDAIRINQQYMEWEKQASGNLPAGSISADSGDITTEVSIWIPAESVTMSEVEEWIGEPDLVYVARSFSSGGRCAGSFVTYSDLGVIMFLYPENSTVGISPTQFVATIKLVPPETVDNWKKITDHWILEWQGYTDYCATTEGLD